MGPTAAANWRELLVHATNEICDRPIRQKGTDHKLIIPRPGSVIAPDSLPSGIVTFVLSGNAIVASHQRRAIDKALTTADVHIWPVPKVKTRTSRSGEVFLDTGLPLNGMATNMAQRHLFNATRLKGMFGIHWEHLRQYSAGANYTRLGIKTVCGGACACQVNLEKLWHLGWEMHY